MFCRGCELPIVVGIYFTNMRNGEFPNLVAIQLNSQQRSKKSKECIVLISVKFELFMSKVKHEIRQMRNKNYTGIRENCKKHMLSTHLLQ